MRWYRSKVPKDPVAEAYLNENRQRPKPDVRISDNTIVVLDAETTGLDIETDRLLSLATVEICHDEIQINSMREWLIYQPNAKWNKAVEVHGILPSETAQGRPESEVLREVLPLFKNHLIVGHHIAFDAAMLNRAAKRHLDIELKNRVIDTAQLAMQELSAFRRTGYPNQRPPSLDEVCVQLGVETMDRHTAYGDAFTTAEVFLVLCARMRQRLGRSIQLRDLPVVKP